ncbi:endonuclease domain-containing protein [Bradyrhizobium ontarionense]|uniref:Endonuclease domain-containing protein n=1 Tax=Bradyrhizobium ontarionense TaxID=2898149 RepID=A0ABY3R5V6_9BRAD|nr:endonuclease domain-containing protein [Bradyrhizobium sp. A19]UFZ02280.1 endonuclease domain-containing protein [Bradyrhizobium sp. A19]
MPPQSPSHRKISRRIRGFAKTMRHQATEAEAVMWRLLRDRRFERYKFRRQTPVEQFILDFVCFEKRLIVEIDGSQHATEDADAERNAILRAAGFRFARYWNNDVLYNSSAVQEDILAKLSEP